MIRFQMYICQVVILYFVTGISIIMILKNLFPSLLSGCVMAALALFLQRYGSGLFWSAVSIGLCAIVYFVIILQFPSIRKELFPLFEKTLKRVRKHN